MTPERLAQIREKLDNNQHEQFLGDGRVIRWYDDEVEELLGALEAATADVSRLEQKLEQQTIGANELIDTPHFAQD